MSLPSPPDDPAEVGRWARGVAELADLRAREGEACGKVEGLREGEAKGLRVAVLDLCERLAIIPTDEQPTRLEAMAVDELEALRQALKTTRRWPGPGL